MCLHIYSLRGLSLENEIVKLKRMVNDNSKKKKNRPDFTTVTFFNKVGLILSFSFVGKINLAKNTMKKIIF